MSCFCIIKLRFVLFVICASGYSGFEIMTSGPGGFVLFLLRYVLRLGKWFVYYFLYD
jgi:hypothetical protein